jgi:copper chaperone CopZ
VTEALTQIPGVSDVAVDLESGAVTVTSDAELDTEAIRAAVTEAGFELEP